jgi:beta-glucanase (GH16 family)
MQAVKASFLAFCFCVAGYAQSAPNPAKWLALNVDANVNSQQEGYRPSQDVVGTSGGLTITAINKAADSSHPYTSGMIATYPFSYKYGTVEYRAEMPGGAGPWPAVWMLGIDCQPKNATTYTGSGCNWKAPGAEELDWTEYLSGVWTTDNENIWSNQVNSPDCSTTVADASKNFHVYDGVWTSTSVIWYVDGKQVCSQAIPSSALTTAMYIMVNIAVCGSASGNCTPSTLPQTLTMNYMRVCPGVTVPCSAAAATLFDDEFNGAASLPPPPAVTVTVQ